jgi:cytochrome c biogenesis protein CcdA/thiol-disulfide isomerase/thioredoxin
MTLFILAYLAGVLTIATPCIFPILPFLLARADVPFRQGGLPLLAGLAVAFAAAASLAAVAGGWAVAASAHGRTVAVLLMTVFGLTLLFPGLATRLMAPLVALGDALANRVGLQATTASSSFLLGIATGLIWAPCAGPVLGLILTGAALHGPGIGTSLLLLTYGLGAATSLAAGLLLGGRVLTVAKRSTQWGDHVRRVLGAAVVAGAAVVWLGLDTGALTSWSSARTDRLERALIGAFESTPAAAAPAAPAAPLSGPLGALAGAPWLTARTLGPDELRGKVVLVNFWTYSCINCLRALPYVRAWATRYGPRGLVVIGVHTPEFAFEKDVANVRRAASALGVGYPVALDNDFRIWRAFGNQAWPARYLIGPDGRVRQRVLGEADYAQTERLIQALLAEAGSAPVSPEAAAIDGAGAQAAADLDNLRSPETYVGYRQASSFASPGGIREDEPTLYRGRLELPLNHWSLAGVWTVGGEFATLGGPSGAIAYRFHARDLHLVMGPSANGEPIRFRVTIDGRPPGADHGVDVDAEGWGSVLDARLYQLVRQSGAVGERTVEIQFFTPGARAYVFTFG